MVGTSQQSARLGFIGVGAMGLPMVGRLVAAGYSVTAWDHAPERLVAAERAGANVAGTAAAVARATEVVFLCLTDAAAVEMVICGPDGVSSVPAPGKLVVDFSSIPPDSACSIAARLNAMNGMSWIDAPVSGGPPGAANGTLAVMAGGEATDIERVKPYVLVMAQRVTHMGPIGARTAWINQRSAPSPSSSRTSTRSPMSRAHARRPFRWQVSQRKCSGC